MNESNRKYDHLFRKAQDAKRGGHDAWAVQSTGEKSRLPSFSIVPIGLWSRTTPLRKLSSGLVPSGLRWFRRSLASSRMKSRRLRK